MLLLDATSRAKRALRPVVADLFDLYLAQEPLALEMREEVLFDDGHRVRKVFDSGWWRPNALANEGQASMLNVYFREQSNVTKYGALLNMAGGSAPTKTTTMSTMTEAVATGTNNYSRQSYASGDWGAPALDSGDHQTQAAQKTFGAFSGNVPVTHFALVTVSTGTAGLFLLYVPTAYYVANNVARTFVNGESYLVTLRDKQV